MRLRLDLAEDMLTGDMKLSLGELNMDLIEREGEGRHNRVRMVQARWGYDSATSPPPLT